MRSFFQFNYLTLHKQQYLQAAFVLQHLKKSIAVENLSIRQQSIVNDLQNFQPSPPPFVTVK